jgi:hypothetical protein
MRFFSILLTPFLLAQDPWIWWLRIRIRCTYFSRCLQFLIIVILIAGGQDSLVELVEGTNRYQTNISNSFTPNSRFVNQINKWNYTRLQQAEVHYTVHRIFVFSLTLMTQRNAAKVNQNF